MRSASRPGDHAHSRGGVPALILLVVATSLATLAAPSAAAPVAAAAPGTLTTFAGGVGEGLATDVAQSPGGLTARNGRLIAVESNLILYPNAAPGLVRSIDLATGSETVFAGIFFGGFSGDGGPATSAQLSRAEDAAFDAAGNVYITDAANARIRKVDPAGTITTFAGNGVAGFSGDGSQATSASINMPAGIAVSSAGDVVFADRFNGRVRKVSPSGTMTTVAGTGTAVGPPNDGGPATAANFIPWAVAFDAADNLYVTDESHGSLRKITADGSITTVASPPILREALAVDGPGNAYVAVTAGIIKIDPSGAITTVAGAGGIPPADSGLGDGGLATEAYLKQVFDVALDGGNIYLATGSRIRRVDLAGIITTVAGNGSRDRGANVGPARSAQFPNVSRVRSGPTGTYFFSPVGTESGYVHRVSPSGTISTIHEGKVDGLAVDDAGDVFFTDGNQVRRLTPSGVVSVVAGTGEAGFGGDGGPATSARLSDPHALAIDGAGNLYVSDTANRRIRRVDPQGIITTFVGGAPDELDRTVLLASDVSLGGVGDLAVDASGSLYWTESTWHSLKIRKVRCGIVTRVSSIGGAIDSLSTNSLAVDAAGSVYYVTSYEVRRVDTANTVSTVAGTGGSVVRDGVPATSVGLWFPGSVAIHPDGGLLFANEDRVLRVEGVTSGRVNPGPPCAGPPDRPVWGTGSNVLGQLGDGSATDRSDPALETPPLTGVTAVAGGYFHSLALRTDGTVWGWGWNPFGQVGVGGAALRLVPVQVPGLTDVVAVAGGVYHSLALKADGTVWSWGWNGYGLLGDGTTTGRLGPAPVPGLSGVVAVSAGVGHNLAVKADGSVWAWGWNGAGQLGDGTVVDRHVPTRVPGITGATAVSAGGLHSLAVKADGSVLAWGWNLYGQLGDGTATDRHVPVPVMGLAGAGGVAAGLYHSLSLGIDGKVHGWGLGHLGQVDGYTSLSATPVEVPYVTDAVALSVGVFHSVALLADGRVTGWGWNDYGQLAGRHRPPTPQSPSPQRSDILGHATAIGAGAYHTVIAYQLVP